MQPNLPQVQVQVNPSIYQKDPESSDLGRRIVTGSIDLLDEVGFDGFTFRKLSQKIQSTEASIYRYFEGKHRILVYLTAWYWGWMEYKLMFRLMNVEPAQERLLRAITVLTEEVVEDSNFTHVNEVKLHRIVIAESSKAYLTKEVDQEHKAGAFGGYHQLVAQVVKLIKEINPDYLYPNMLVSTLIEGAHHQRFFARHLPQLTDEVKGEDAITKFYQTMVTRLITT